MKNILLSLIGIGKGQNGKGYIKTKYKFENGQIYETAFFGSALYRYISTEKNIDKWFIFGTNKSSWSEIIDTVEENQDILEELYIKVRDEEKNGISENTLKEWQEKLSKFIPGIELILTDPLDYKFYVEFLIKNLPDDDLFMILDITHGYRFMPFILSFSLMYIKNFKKIADLDIYYGAFEMKKEVTPVIKIDFINELFKLSTSYELYKYSGYFPEILKNLGIQNTQNIYFQIEMNWRPQKELRDIITKLDNIKEEYKVVCAKNIKKELQPLLEKELLEDRMVERAKYFFEKNQYLKSLILIYEAITICMLKRSGVSNIHEISNRKDFIRDKIPQILKEEWMQNTFKTLEGVRNSAVHGNIRDNSISQHIKDKEKFSELFKSSLILYEKLKK
jgi:cell division protein DivIC